MAYSQQRYKIIAIVKTNHSWTTNPSTPPRRPSRISVNCSLEYLLRMSLLFSKSLMLFPVKIIMVLSTGTYSGLFCGKTKTWNDNLLISLRKLICSRKLWDTDYESMLLVCSVLTMLNTINTEQWTSFVVLFVITSLVI